VTVVLVTARPPRRVRALTAGLDLDALAICSNGALIYDLRREAVIEQTRLPPALAIELVATLRAQLPELCFAVEAGLRFGQEAQYARHLRAYTEHEQPELGDAAALCVEGVTKLIALHPTLDREGLLARVSALVGARAVVTHSGAAFVEIAAAGVTKASALSRHCQERGIAAEYVVAFGDMPNDIPMLRWAGHAVVVDNAHPEVLRVAHEVTASNEKDGVAIVLERLLESSAAL
jgi:Cof subfamily protein (haloacid dehalogenase superfamily)